MSITPYKGSRGKGDSLRENVDCTLEMELAYGRKSGRFISIFSQYESYPFKGCFI